MKNRIFILTIKPTEKSDKQPVEVIKNTLDEVLTAKEDFKDYFGYQTVEIVSIHEAWISEEPTDKLEDK